jgi:YidC/Oxa1 family membrane protein insertase
MSMSANLRVFLWALFGAALLLNYEFWTREFPPTVAPSSPAPNQVRAPFGNSAPVAPAPSSPAAPSSSASSEAAPSSAAVAAPTSTALPAASAPSVHVVTDVLDLTVSLDGGNLVRAELLAYPQQKNTPNQPVRLLDDSQSTSLFEVQGGLAGTSGEPAPTALARYSSDVRELKLAPGQKQLTLPLTWTDGRGLKVTKTLVLHRGRYAIEVDYHIDNGGSTPWDFAQYAQILRYNEPVSRSYFNPSSYAYKGPAFDNGSKFAKLELQKSSLDQMVRGGYLAALQLYFVAAIVPPPDESFRYTLQSQGNQFLLKALGPTRVVPAGGSASAHDTLFVGPKLQSQLDQVQPQLDLVTDYGTLTVIAKPMFWLLQHVHALVGNWGFAIIIVTLLIKLLFYPLSEASGRSMAKMRALAPRLNSLRETYKDDREKLNKAMMELYQREKINPLAGCLPVVIQIPVFFAWYWVLRDSVEMRQAPFVFWINDLSARDPYFVLPIIMAVAMYIQTKLNPQVGDPTQQKLMTFMPIAMSVTFAFFPAGLVLYWVTNTVLSILQQWNINRRIEAVDARARR